MIIIPAIDLLGGMCVRLRKGEYGTAAKVAEDPAETLLGFAEAGAEYIHLVDLDGAKAGAPVNDGIIKNLIKLSPVPVEIGGGIRTYESAKDYLGAGAGRIILGSVALTSPGLVKRLAAEFGGRIAVGIDARNGIVKTSGWLEDSDSRFDVLASEMEKAGVRCVIYTDIERDGMLSGVDLKGLARLKEVLSPDTKITASGGVCGIGDIRALKELGIYGAITGKAVYSGALDLREAIAVTKE